MMMREGETTMKGGALSQCVQVNTTAAWSVMYSSCKSVRPTQAEEPPRSSKGSSNKQGRSTNQASWLLRLRCVSYPQTNAAQRCPGSPIAMTNETTDNQQARRDEAEDILSTRRMKKKSTATAASQSISQQGPGPRPNANESVHIPVNNHELIPDLPRAQGLGHGEWVRQGRMMKTTNKTSVTEGHHTAHQGSGTKMVMTASTDPHHGGSLINAAAGR